jgi:glucuronoarabinoxylan endo-1,4-beta-xylanase
MKLVKPLALLAALTMILAGGCQSDSPGPGPSGGTNAKPGTGGAGAGGSVGPDGAMGLGGTSTTGDTIGRGGDTGAAAGKGSGGTISTGGTTGRGGSAAGGTVGTVTTGAGGALTSGGTTGTGGNLAGGGSVGTGGAAGTGGVGGTVGVLASGGVTGAGSTAGTGGTTGKAGAGGSTLACPSSSACVDFTSLQQEIDGFGAASVGHGALTTTDLDTAFKNDTNSQLGLSIVRVEVRVEGESAWSTEKANAAGAKARGAKYAMASPWTAPASMKSNNNTVGGSLSTSAYADYAAYLKSFAKYMGSDLDVISMQNEPNIVVTYVSCSWNPTQMFNFIKNNAQDIGTAVLMPETSNYDKSYSDPVLNDATAASHVTHIGLHLYGAGASTYTLAVQKQKKVWMTEHMYDPDDIGTMMTMSKEIMDCMNSQMNAYIWWYLRVPNCNLITASGGITNKGYIMGQFSKYIRPGSHRTAAPYQPQSNVNVQAYAGAKNVIVALNRNTSAKTQDFTIVSGAFANAHKYTTSNTKKLADDGPVTVTNGSFTATLDPQSVTTFVADGTP